MEKEIQVSFTDKQVSAWGGMKIMKDMLDSIGIKEFMGGLDLRKKFRTVVTHPYKLCNVFGPVSG